MIGQAQPEASNGYADGWETGRQEGYQQGLLTARQEVEATVHAAAAIRLTQQLALIDTAVQALRAQADQMQQQLREDLPGLVEQICRLVIRRELQADPAQLLRIIEEALLNRQTGQDPVPETLDILLNPDDFSALMALDLPVKPEWRLMADSLLAPGECRIHSIQLDADAGCEHRLQHCLDSLKTQLNSTGETAHDATFITIDPA